MDRDQVNLMHYLFQGFPPMLTIARLMVQAPEEKRLIWCKDDTLQPLLSCELLERRGDEVRLPNLCVCFINEVEQQLRSLPKPDFAFGYPFSAAIREPGDPRPAFLAISYAPRFDATKACVLDAAKVSNFRCEVTGDLANPGNIMDQVWQGIRSADAVVADVTGGNPNVMLEVGIAAALGKEVMVISQDEGLPFDIRHWRKITYAADRLPELKAALVTAFAAVSARYPFEGPEPRF